MASDGLWEFMSVEEVAEFAITRIKGGMLCHQVAAELVEHSRDLWRESEGDDYCDDITVVLLPLAIGPAPTLTGVNAASDGYGFFDALGFINPCSIGQRKCDFCG